MAFNPGFSIQIFVLQFFEKKSLGLRLWCLWLTLLASMASTQLSFSSTVDALRKYVQSWALMSNRSSSNSCSCRKRKEIAVSPHTRVSGTVTPNLSNSCSTRRSGKNLSHAVIRWMSGDIRSGLLWQQCCKHWMLTCLTSSLLLYSGGFRGRELSRISWFCGFLWKFSSQNLGAWRPLAWHEVFSTKIVFFTNTRKFPPPSKVSHYTIVLCWHKQSKNNCSRVCHASRHIHHCTWHTLTMG